MRELALALALALALGSLVVVTAPAHAEGTAVEALTLDEAIARALEHNHDVARAATSILGAEAALLRARAATLPTVEVSATETRIEEERGFDGAVTQPDTQLRVFGSASVPLFAPATWARRAQAAEQVEVSRFAAADVRKEVAVAVAQTYVAVIAAQRQVEVDQRAVDNAQAQYDWAETRRAEGAGSRLNALRAAEVLASSSVLLERSRLALRLTQEALGLLVAADRPMDAAVEPDFATPAEEQPIALDQRTDLRVLAAQRAAAERVLHDSWKDWMPLVEAGFVPLWVDPPGAFEDSSTWSFSVGARMPLYLGGERKADRRARAADLSTAEIDLDQAELRARAEVRAARAAIEAAERGSDEARLAAEHANEVLRITEIAFRAGATTNIELVDAQRRARDSETAAARAADLLRLARLDLLVALGLFPG